MYIRGYVHRYSYVGELQLRENMKYYVQVPMFIFSEANTEQSKTGARRRCTYLTQGQYTLSSIKKFGIEECRGATIPRRS